MDGGTVVAGGGLSLDRWIARRLGVASPLTETALAAALVERLAATLAHARAESPFYRSLADWPDQPPARVGDLARWPFTLPADLARGRPPLLALSQAEVARVVSLPTSGTYGPAKRLFFSVEDIEATVDFIAAGMGVLTRPGDRVAVAFPAARPGGIGQNLVTALRRIDATPIIVPLEANPAELVTLLRRERIDVIAGPPARLNAAARLSAVDGGPPLRLRAALVSAEATVPALRAALARLWGAEVFDHWGMTETGLGGAVECQHHVGCHIRELDLVVEIIDPATGVVVPDGTSGEVVVTTLGRRAMPLIRYRTGDRGRLETAPCRCGSRLKRLVDLSGRFGAGYPLGDDLLTLATLDEALFALDHVGDYAAEIVTAGAVPTLYLALAVPQPVRARFDLEAVTRALAAAPVVGSALTAGALELDLMLVDADACRHAGKRKLVIS